MKKSINRRDFIKLSAAMLFFPVASDLLDIKAEIEGIAANNSQFNNVIIILFDALSALHLTTYDYPRSTSPNLAKFADRSFVYHNHHSAGNFTTPSTASFLTGTYPWKHRAFAYGNRVNEQHAPGNMFGLLRSRYNQIAYTQNLYADTFLRQFSPFLDRHLPLGSFSLTGGTFYDNFAQKDSYYAMGSLDDFLFDQDETSGSLFLSPVTDFISAIKLVSAKKKFQNQYPLGFPRQPKTKLAFTIDQVIDGVIQSMENWESPFLAYLHFIPPHSPYRPHRDYLDFFNDSWEPIEKPVHQLSKEISQDSLNKSRRDYDRYIANLDAEVGRLFDYLEGTGLMENSYVIFTSDHGEMFERGMRGHSTRMVFEPILRIPLFISVPGNRLRKDIYSLTNTVDLLPTLLHIAGLRVPEWCEGMVLPGFGAEKSSDRPAYAVEAKSNSIFKPLTKASVVLFKDQYKLIRYLGYKGAPYGYEFFDLKNDPEELNNLYLTHKAAKEMQAALDLKISQVNKPFTKET
ncbi:MAG: sulfatase [Anaerolineales bacterium]|jgi:arylsulfatase A-like enzyme